MASTGEESIWSRAKRDTEAAIKGIRFWLFEIVVGGSVAAWASANGLGAWWAFVFLTTCVFAGVCLAFSVSLARAPFRQRDEARELARRLSRSRESPETIAERLAGEQVDVCQRRLIATDVVLALKDTLARWASIYDVAEVVGSVLAKSGASEEELGRTSPHSRSDPVLRYLSLNRLLEVQTREEQPLFRGRGSNLVRYEEHSRWSNTGLAVIDALTH